MVADDPCTHASPEPGCCLIRQLRLARTGESAFDGTLRGGRSDPGRAFGGCFIGHALLAAGTTVPDGLLPGSLHAYFVSPGAAGTSVRYRVEHVRDGRSSAVRQVTAEQDGVTRLVVLIAFRAPAETGAEHQRVPPALGAPPILGPGPACRCDASDPTCGLAVHAAMPEAEPGAAAGTDRATWLRLRHRLGNRPLWHAAALSYMSDLATIRTVDQPHRHEDGRRLAASVDHALWFHRPFRADEWLYYAQRSPVYAGGRGICQGEFYDATGRLVASCAQEVSLRRLPGLLRRTNPAARRHPLGIVAGADEAVIEHMPVRRAARPPEQRGPPAAIPRPRKDRARPPRSVAEQDLGFPLHRLVPPGAEQRALRNPRGKRIPARRFVAS